MASPTIAQHKSNFGTAVTTISATLAGNVTAGNMIVVWVSCGFGATINTPTMTGETFTKITGASNAGGGANGQVSCYASNSAVGGHSQVTATTSSSEDIHLHVVEVSGQSGSPQDATGNTESATLSVSTSGATTTATDLVLGFFYDNAANQTVSAGSGYAQVEQSNNTTGGDVAFSESKSVSSTGTQTATITDGGSGNTYNQSILAIAGASGSTTVFEDDSFMQYQPPMVEPTISIW